jgi:hypothetical protein
MQARRNTNMSLEPDSTGKPVKPQGKYANYFEVGMNQQEAVIDFGQAYEGQSAISFHTRIITSPAYAKDLATMIETSIRELGSDGPRGGKDKPRESA